MKQKKYTKPSRGTILLAEMQWNNMVNDAKRTLVNNHLQNGEFKLNENGQLMFIKGEHNE